MNSQSKVKPMWAKNTLNYALLIAAAMLGALSVSYYLQDSTLITPLSLGIIAAALAESDDSFWGRIRAILLTFLCFAFASWSTAILFPYPLLFSIGLLTSTFGFVMLGAIGPRYSSIAFGSLLIAIYTMLGMDTTGVGPDQTFLLLAGAFWYYLLSMIWNSVFPMQPVQQAVSDVFDSLGAYLHSKSQLFKASETLVPQPFRLREAELNAVTVAHLETCKALFIHRSKKGVVDGPSDRFLRLYFLAQDIHERVSSTHYRYQELAQAFGRSDILFRFQHLLEEQASACQHAALSVSENKPFQYQPSHSLIELTHSLEHLDTHATDDQRSLLPQLHFLFKNLCSVEQQLRNISNPDAIEFEGSKQLDDDQPTSIKAMMLRVWKSLSLSSPLCRHAIRLSLALTLGYGIIQLFSISHGYWILLTTLFVCQPNFSATKQKLRSRLIGTLAGLLVGGLLLTLLPTQLGQMMVITISAVLFFSFRLNNYGYATAFITVLVLFCFAQLGEGYGVILPRLIDTLIGGSLATLAVIFILPDWQAKRLPNTTAKAFLSNKAYLDQTIAQYRLGKEDGLAYRIARREAHFADAQLSTAISNMMMEPEKYQQSKEHYFRLLTLNHALLSYISTLGSHRQRLDDESLHKAILDAHATIRMHLDRIAQHINDQLPLTSFSGTYPATLPIDDELPANLSVSLILQQMHLIYRMLPEMYSLTSAINTAPITPSEPEA
ncbi:YccS family putative transporter [Vibrio ulleungensis]|uniref:TIGR01666 family membrane protein n=1 Tax=Vibrio ulleungensis TaxID=2807619 RepID=A0ABS2HDT5_9VIBR|nr:YccS family putative transporter [Vibrio ulleungensis]MBM7035755.1 TIGR01666 family membrane protein [Vibrio ulleungensis]